MPNTPLLMIPGPIEISPSVLQAHSVPPPSHVSSNVIEAFGRSLKRMRTVWQASADSQPFIVAGSGTLAMDIAAANIVEANQRVLVVNTGYFSDRMTAILQRFQAEVIEVKAETVGDQPTLERIEAALDTQGPFTALFATHVDTSTGVRVDAKKIAEAARARGVLSVFDGVCAAVGESFAMEEWGADVYLTGSQKAIGLPAGLALMVVSARALAARAQRKQTPPPLSLDWHQWLPIMQAYEEQRPSYFATPATNLILALDVALDEILDQGVAETFATHQRVADGMRAAWSAMGLHILPVRAELAANTLSAVRYPDGVDSSLTGRIKAGGVIVAGGLLPGMKQAYFRVGHMGYVTTRRDLLLRTVHTIEQALIESGHTFPAHAGTEALLHHIDA